jgi:hypothetical protein
MRSGFFVIMLLLVQARYAAAMYTGWNQSVSGRNTLEFKTWLSVFSRHAAIVGSRCCAGEKAHTKKRDM